MVAITCPHCADTKQVIKFGKTAAGSARCRCKACGKSFTLAPKSRELTPQKERLILNALAERISQRGIARALQAGQVGRQSVRNVRKKTQGA
jgi:transposase-like protein